ncbi:hypothetical protein FRB95_000656, partial [Tulasnella sp. JGI-2019a]
MRFYTSITPLLALGWLASIAAAPIDGSIERRHCPHGKHCGNGGNGGDSFGSGNGGNGGN